MAPKPSNKPFTSVIDAGIGAKKLDGKVQGALVIEDLGGVVHKHDDATFLSHCQFG